MRRSNLPLLAILALIIIAWVAAPDLFTAPQQGTSDNSAAETAAAVEQGTLYEVLRVVDGDTIVIDNNGSEEKVRLIGVDAPESVHADATQNTEYGALAAAFTKEKLEGQQVTLELDTEERDDYDRLLAYVYLDDEMFNKTLLSAGYAAVATFPPNVKYADDFVELQRQAREAGAGLWQGKLEEGAYVADLTGSVYHSSDCELVKDIAADNRIWFTDTATAETAGYTACPACLDN